MTLKENCRWAYKSRIFYDEPMSNHTTLRVGGKAEIFVECGSVKDLNFFCETANEYGREVKIVGNGSNLLVSDRGYNGIVISLKNLRSVKRNGELVTAFCGATFAEVIDFCENNGFTGSEEFSGLPSQVGGAVVMNAGAFGASVSDYVESVTVLRKGKLFSLDKSDCDFSYRNSVFKRNGDVICSVNFRFPVGGFDKEKAERCLEKRKEKQPSGKSCGSVFLNPDGDYAGRLIDEAGLKGFSIGGAKISDKHANFIINTGDATSHDVYSLIKQVKNTVYGKFGVSLVEEVEYLGEF